MSAHASPSAAPSLALLVIDIQQGAFDGELCPPIDDADALVAGARTLVAAAREGGVPIVFIQHSDDEPGPFEDGTRQWQLHPDLSPTRDDHVMKKPASSSFERTALDDHLRGRDVGALVLCGLQSEFCVTNTARAALGLGYRVFVAEDAHATWPSEGRTSAAIRRDVNDDLRRAGIGVAAVARLADELRRGAR